MKCLLLATCGGRDVFKCYNYSAGHLIYFKMLYIIFKLTYNWQISEINDWHEFDGVNFTLKKTRDGPHHQWWTFSSFHGLVMTGGNDNNVQSVRGYNADGFHIEDLPPLPTSKIGHCVVALDGYELFVTGKAI